jgi:hypothetical protein
MRDLVARAGSGELSVTLRVTETGGYGLSAFLYGGTLPHVGGSALASPGVTIRGEKLSSCDLWVQTVPGHKDSVIAQDCARELCLVSGQPVSVVAGVHVDGATTEQLKTLINNCKLVSHRIAELLVAGDK